MKEARHLRREWRHNSRMDLMVTVAVQRVLRPRCLLLVSTAHARVRHTRLRRVLPAEVGAKPLGMALLPDDAQFYLALETGRAPRQLMG